MSNRALNLSLDAASLVGIVGYFAGALPAIAALGAVIWYGIQIYESKTVQRHIRRLRLKAIRKRREQAPTDQRTP